MKYSIIIIHYKNILDTKNCLKSILKQTYKNFEIIIFNNSNQGNFENEIRKIYKTNNLKIITSKKNQGYAGGVYQAEKKAKGDIILILNNDTIINKKLLLLATDEFKKKNSADIMQPMLVQNSKVSDSFGVYSTPTTFLYHLCLFSDYKKNNFKNSLYLFSVKGAAMFVKKKVFTKIGSFYPFFWNYYEETDFCHRAWICGFKTIFNPKLGLVYHLVGSSSAQYSKGLLFYHNFKNKFFSNLVNYSALNLPLVIFKHILILIICAFAFTFNKNYSTGIFIIKSFFWPLLNVRLVLKERKKVQKNRVLSDSKIDIYTKFTPPIQYYFKFLKRMIVNNNTQKKFLLEKNMNEEIKKKFLVLN
jgi:GT2 family glycosyltransferase